MATGEDIDIDFDPLNDKTADEINKEDYDDVKETERRKRRKYKEDLRKHYKEEDRERAKLMKGKSRFNNSKEENIQMGEFEDNLESTRIDEGIPKTIDKRWLRVLGADNEEEEYNESEERIKDFVKTNYPNAINNVSFRDNVSIEEVDGIITAKYRTDKSVWKFNPDGRLPDKAGVKLKRAFGEYYEEVLDEIEGDVESKEKVINELKKIKTEKYDLEREKKEYLDENTKWKDLHKNTEKELKEYNEEIIKLRLKIAKTENKKTTIKKDLFTHTVDRLKEKVDDLQEHLNEKQKYLLYIEKEINTQKELHNSVLSEIERLSTSKMERELQLDFAINKKQQEIEILREKSDKIKSRLNLKQKIKQIFKEHGFTIFGIAASVGTIIATVVSILKNGSAVILKTVGTGTKKVLKTVGEGFKTLGKKVGAILPGMIGAIASFIFKTAGEVFGFLAENAWILILATVFFVVEKFSKK